MTPVEFNQTPTKTINSNNTLINCFSDKTKNKNIDNQVVDSFGEEWEKFSSFTEDEIKNVGNMYFDIVNDDIINKDTYAIDIGCGTGRWSKYLIDKIGFMEAIDPSKAIFSASKLLSDKQNIRFSQASTDNIPFNDETFDFGMSIGVLHHIPNTEQALTDCVKKIKKGGHFYLYLYYDLEGRSTSFKFLFKIVNTIRKFVSKLPNKSKKIICDLIAILIYLPIILIGRFLSFLGLKTLANKLPLNIYQKTSFYIIRNDALDRFGTTLEQRFSKSEITKMMSNAGLRNIKISDNLPYWHAIGQKL